MLSEDFFKCDYFALFGLSPSTDLDLAQLRARYQSLQTTAHPDRFAAAPDSDRRAALQMAGRINDAYNILQNPLRRAAYLLSLRGVDAFAEDNVVMPPAFLMQQIEWREALETADEAACAALLVEITAARDTAAQNTAAALTADDTATATDNVRQWRYLEKILAEKPHP